MFRWFILFQEILKKRDAGWVIAHKDCSVNSLSLPCLETLAVFYRKRKVSTVFIVMDSASSGPVVPRNKCPPCLWVGFLVAPQRQPAQKPFLGRWGHACPQRHTVKVSEAENGGLLYSWKERYRLFPALLVESELHPITGGFIRTITG